jgi:hypothetical protein
MILLRSGSTFREDDPLTTRYLPNFKGMASVSFTFYERRVGK